jgi:hypothetical protein
MTCEFCKLGWPLHLPISPSQDGRHSYPKDWILRLSIPQASDAKVRLRIAAHVFEEMRIERDAREMALALHQNTPAGFTRELVAELLRLGKN